MKGLKIIVLICFVLFVLMIVDVIFGFIMFKNDSPYKYIQKHFQSSNPQPLYVAQPFLNYINNPDYINESGQKQINAWGLRHNRDIKLPKPSNIIRILFLGGSTTFGEVEKTENTFSAILEKRLNSSISQISSPHKTIECINAGLGAATSAELLIHYLLKYKYLQPDVVVIHAGINDAFATVSLEDYVYQPDYHTSKAIFKNPMPVNRFIRFLSFSNIFTFAIVKTLYREYLKNSFTENPFFTYHDKHIWYPNGNEEKFKTSANGYYNNISELVNILKNHGKKVLLVTEVVDTFHMPIEYKIKLSEGIELNNQFTIRIGMEKSVPVCVLPKSNFGHNLFITNDGIHVNEKGELTKAELIETYLLKILLEHLAYAQN
ncbi:MAG: SGNH/GDSL hydrolase family protein [Chitinophagales bacterium]|nr:SGNH/GDSL hydrolase family protein [Chitinophagales bacterium]MDW8274331.1 SGNH/GDSL hydrolase family protein [Chitinophagales bacterium]